MPNIVPVVLVCHCNLNGREYIGIGMIGNVVDVNFGGRVDGSNLAGDVPDLCGNLEVSFIGCNARSKVFKGGGLGCNVG